MTMASTAPSNLDGSAGAGAWRLVVLASPDAGKVGDSKVLSAAHLVVGRAEPGPDRFSLEDGEVSRAHARVERPDPEGRWRIIDLESRNGTFVNGERIGERELAAGDVVRVGAHVLLLQYLSAADCQVLVAAPLERGRLRGDSVGMMRVRLDIRTVGRSARPILVLGETGVGKELVAAEIHRVSGRSGKLVAVNCAALPENLVESELFGHVKGAFTGATGTSHGLFGEADGGTLFLDEIGEMPLPLQAKLLRALATGEVRGVGEKEPRHVDVRVVAATNVDLEAAIDRGTFRADLYSRLMGSTVRVPPLRERKEDVLPLAQHFLRAADREGVIGVDAAEALVVHRWRFNVRELEQVVHAAALKMPEGAALDLDVLSAELCAPLLARRGPPSAAGAALPLPLRVRRDAVPSGPDLEEVLRHFDGNVAQVAEYFGKDRRQIYRWAERLGVDVEAFRA